MSEGMDRKIAELVMGEPEPPTRYSSPDAQPYVFDDDAGVDISLGGNWIVAEVYRYRDATHIEWQPLPFSTDLDQAMRAWHQRFGGDVEMRLLCEHYYDHCTEQWLWKARQETFMGSHLGDPDMLQPTAICNLFLALVEKEGK